MDNIDWLIDSVTKQVIVIITEEQKIPYEQAIKNFYNSKTFESLSDRETFLYRESPALVYTLYCEE